MPTLLPLDQRDQPIPALRLKSGGAHSISVSATAAVNTNAFDEETRIISIYATVPVYLKFGDDETVATSSDHYFPSGVYYDFAIGGGISGHYTHVSAIAVGSSGSIYISEKE